MVDRPPPQRFRIVERGGRLEVIDSETGGRPLSAAERMAVHDAANGHTSHSFHRFDDIEDMAATPLSAPSLVAPKDPIRAALAQRADPWKSSQNSQSSRPQLGAQSAAEAQARPSAAAKPEPTRTKGQGKSSTMVTSTWWDSKGPRTINLDDDGRKRLTTGFVTALVVGFFIAMVLLIIQPALLFVAGFLLLRFGSKVTGPIGARLVDEAIKANGGGR